MTMPALASGKKIANYRNEIPCFQLCLTFWASRWRVDDGLFCWHSQRNYVEERSEYKTDYEDIDCDEECHVVGSLSLILKKESE
jgi:hypothetical protein